MRRGTIVNAQDLSEEEWQEHRRVGLVRTLGRMTERALEACCSQDALHKAGALEERRRREALEREDPS